MFAVENLQIVRQLSRDDIIKQMLSVNSMRAERFIQSYKLTQEEISLFWEQFSQDTNVICALQYYQLQDKEVYSRKLKKEN